MRRTWMVSILLTMLVAGCAPGQSPEEVQAQINTAVAQTMQAQSQIDSAVQLTVQAQNALASPTPTDTATPTAISFPTLTPVVFTVTPLPVSGGGGGGGGGGGSSSSNAYSCDIIHQRPRDGEASYSPGDKFDIKWTILNTGTATWRAGLDVKYWSGPHLNTSGGNVVQIPTALKPGDQFDIWMDGQAPATKGHFVMTWVVEGKYCWLYTAIDVH